MGRRSATAEPVCFGCGKVLEGDRETLCGRPDCKSFYDVVHGLQRRFRLRLAGARRCHVCPRARAEGSGFCPDHRWRRAPCAAQGCHGLVRRSWRGTPRRLCDACHVQGPLAAGSELRPAPGADQGSEGTSEQQPAETSGQLLTFQDPYVNQVDGRWVQQCLGGMVQARALVTIEHRLGGPRDIWVSTAQYIPATPFSGIDNMQPVQP